MEHVVQIDLNGQPTEFHAEAATPLLWALRCDKHLTGTKFGCGVSVCGACTVIVDDEAEYACQLTLGELRQRGAKRITTIEGLSGPVADALRQAWIDCDVVQCGYCQSAQLIAAAHLLARTRAPSDEAIKTAMSRVLCRCGTYPRILKAIGQAVSRLGRR